MKNYCKGPGRGLFFCVLLQLIISCGGCSLGMFPAVKPEEVSLLSYNVQNLFDDVHDGNEYPDYDPSGDSWNSDLYHLKLLHLSDVVSRFPEGGADILMLQEVENHNALDTLNAHYLKGTGYRHCCISNCGDSAVNTAILSRYPIKNVMAHSVSLDGRPAGRPILECEIELDEIRVCLLNCHWKSKSGGAEETEPLRRAAAAVVTERILQIYAQDPQRPIILAGDLNECIDEWEREERAYFTALMDHGGYEGLPAYQRKKSLGVTGTPVDGEVGNEKVVLLSPWLIEPRPSRGSYAYQGSWETIDHFLLSPSLRDGQGLEFDDFQVVRDEQLLNNEGFPLRWISELESGYSDHLPLLLRCRLK